MDAALLVLGIDLGGTKIALAVADQEGGIRRRIEIPTNASRGAPQALERAIGEGQRLIAWAREENLGRVGAVGVATMGITLADRVVMAPNVPGWGELAIPAAMTRAFPTMRVTVDNDVKAAAWAESRWGALKNSRAGLFLNLGTGIAAALTINGRVVRGSHGAAGEIAYNPRHLHEDAGARDGRAPLEEFVGGGALTRRVRARFGPECTVEELFRRADDVTAAAFVEATLSEIALHATTLAIAFDPDRVAVGGGLMASKELVLPILADNLDRFVPFPPEVVEASFTRDAGLMGAVALAVEPIRDACSPS